MRLLFLTGSRGEWGYIRPMLGMCKDRGIDYNICATNMHLLPSFGLSVDEIKADGFEVSDEIYMALDGYNHHTMTKSMGHMLSSFTDVLYRVKPDWLVLAGDRGETLMGAIAGAYTYIPTAHIQAGELSGNIDGQARHAIGKFAHLHLASNEDAGERLIKLGEEPHRVHVVGAPQIDELVAGKVSTLDELEHRFSHDFSKDFLLVVLHPVTEEFDIAEQMVTETIAALSKFKMPKFWIMPNNDAGSDLISSNILKERKADCHIFKNLKREDFVGLLKNCSCLVGNSSAGLLEAPSFETASVNIGNRQNQRVRGTNVIDVKEYNAAAIVKGIHEATSQTFQEKIKGMKNPYGDGDSSKKILDLLEKTPRDKKLLVKKLMY